MNLTQTNISFLKDIPNHIYVDMTSGWRFHHYPHISIAEILKFVRLIEGDNTYLIIPMFRCSKSESVSSLNLSEPFLIDNNSNPELILKFIMTQWNTSGFNIKLESQIYFSMKFKRVWLSFK